MRLRRRSDNTGPPTGVGVGLVVASAMAPGTFARSLSARSAIDQGMVTGLSTGLHYLLTVGTQDMLQAAAAELAGGRSGRRSTGEVRRQRRLTLAADLAAIPLGLAVRAALPERPGEPMLRGTLRQVGWRFAVTGIGASLADRHRDRAGAAGPPAGGAAAGSPGCRSPYRSASASRSCWSTAGSASRSRPPSPRPADRRPRCARSASPAPSSAAWRSRRTPSTRWRRRPAAGWPPCCPAARSCGS